MKTIYKSISLEAALLSVTLALQAEIQSEGETVTADVQASTLDRLRVTLVSPNVSGARDLVASGNAVIEGSEIAVNLENLGFGTHRLIVSARFGTQIRTLYALDISVPQAELPNETQEYEDAAIVVSTYGDGGGEFPTDYAKQGDDPTATLTDTQAYAQAAAEAAQSLIAVDADIFAGKQALATNISAKGVPTSVSDALATMATKVLQIPQQLNTGISEFEQMIAPSPYMWNVYTVATDLMKDTLPNYIPSYMSGGIYTQYRAYNAFFVGEYYLGYDTLELEGAEGYLTCDGHFYTITGEVGSRVVTHTLPDGTVETYAAETIVHTWADGASGYCNRWVGFFYLTNAYSFTNTTSEICPRRVALCGDCLSFIISGVSRIVDIWVIGTLGHFEGGSGGGAWNPSQSVENYKEHTSGVFFPRVSLLSLIMPDLESLSAGLFSIATSAGQNFYADYLSLPNLKTLTTRALYFLNQNSRPPVYILLQSLQTLSVPIITLNDQISNAAMSGNMTVVANSLEVLNITGVGGGYSGATGILNAYNNCLRGSIRIILKSLKRITRGYIIREYGTYRNNFTGVIDIEVGAMETNLDIRGWHNTTVSQELLNNIRDHILAKVSDRTDLSQLTFTVGSDMFSAISGENIEWQGQTMTLADAFLTKNWLLAGA